MSEITSGIGLIAVLIVVFGILALIQSKKQAEIRRKYPGYPKGHFMGKGMGIGIAIGANWNGARAFTATSGPGISLMSEMLGLAYFAEIPLVLIDVQRTGPSTGMPTRTQQSDLFACAYASHGDTKNVLLLRIHTIQQEKHLAWVDGKGNPH